MSNQPDPFLEGIMKPLRLEQAQKKFEAALVTMTNDAKDHKGNAIILLRIKGIPTAAQCRKALHELGYKYGDHYFVPEGSEVALLANIVLLINVTIAAIEYEEACS